MTRYIEVIERIPAPEFPEIDLPEEDGIPLETNWHRMCINLLIASLRRLWRHRTDFFAGGNMFVYYSLQQAEMREYKGPAFFVVLGIKDGTRDRKSWKVWEEYGRYPDVIVELLSPSTADADLGSKKDLYERTFHTANYFCYDPDDLRLLGWRLGDDGYLDLTPNERGWLWCHALQLWLGQWRGAYDGITATWLRFYDADGNLVLTGEEDERRLAEAERRRVEAERQRAEAERQRADAAEAEAARLREELNQLRGQN